MLSFVWANPRNPTAFLPQGCSGCLPQVGRLNPSLLQQPQAIAVRRSGVEAAANKMGGLWRRFEGALCNPDVTQTHAPAAIQDKQNALLAQMKRVLSAKQCLRKTHILLA